jgi:hypothetical protein
MFGYGKSQENNELKRRLAQLEGELAARATALAQIESEKAGLIAESRELRSRLDSFAGLFDRLKLYSESAMKVQGSLASLAVAMKDEREQSSKATASLDANLQTVERISSSLAEMADRTNATAIKVEHAETLQFIKGFQGFSRASGRPGRSRPGRRAPDGRAARAQRRVRLRLRGQAGEQVGLGAGGDFAVFQGAQAALGVAHHGTPECRPGRPPRSRSSGWRGLPPGRAGRRCRGCARPRRGARWRIPGSPGPRRVSSK